MWCKANLNNQIETFAHTSLNEIKRIGLMIVVQDLNIENDQISVFLFEEVDESLVGRVDNSVVLSDELIEALQEVHHETI